mgnify:CR=1 FL=1
MKNVQRDIEERTNLTGTNQFELLLFRLGADSALGKSLERSQQFLLLSALLTLLLAVAAVAVAMSHYCRSRYDLVAILKTLGAGRADRKSTRLNSSHT